MELLIILIGGIALFWYGSSMEVHQYDPIARMLFCLFLILAGMGLIGFAVIRAILALP